MRKFESDPVVERFRSLGREMAAFQIETLNRPMSFSMSNRDLNEQRKMAMMEAPTGKRSEMDPMHLPSHPRKSILPERKRPEDDDVPIIRCSSAASLNVVLSGVTPLSCCRTGGSWWTAYNALVNGSYALSFVSTIGGITTWRLLNALSFDDSNWSDSGCTLFVATFNRVSNLVVRCNVVSPGVYEVGTPSHSIFFGSGKLGLPISNFYATCYETGFNGLFNNGTATVTEI